MQGHFWINDSLVLIGFNTVYRGWVYLALSLVSSAGFLLSSRQDVRLAATTGAIFGQVMALLMLIGMAAKAIFMQWWIEALISAAAFCVEVWLMKRWWRRRPAE